MVLPREEIEARIKKRSKRRRIIWLSIAGALALFIIFICVYQFTDIFVGVPQTTQSSPQGSDQWTMFRRDLAHTGNAGTETLPQGNLKWTFATGAPVTSSPAVVDGTVYFGSQDAHIYAVDAATGRQKWAFEAGSWVVSSPVVYNGVVYCGCNDGKMYALKADTGEKIWEFATPYSIRSSPAIADGVIYVGADDYSVWAINAATGRAVWHKKTGHIVTGSPAVAKGLVIIGSSDGKVYTYNAKNGRVRLQFPTSGYLRSSVAVQDGTAYFTDTSGYFTAIDITAKNWLWETKIVQYWKVMWVYGVAPKPPDRSGFIWEIQLGTGISSASSAALDGNNAYLGFGRDIVAIDLATHEVQWRYTTGDSVTSSPALADTALYAGSSDGHLYAVSRADGTLLWKGDLGAATSSSPALADGTLYIGCDDGKLYAFD